MQGLKKLGFSATVVLVCIFVNRISYRNHQNNNSDIFAYMYLVLDVILVRLVKAV